MQKIELSSAHTGRRLAAAIVLLVVGVVALVYAFTWLFSAEAGWQEIEVSSSAGLSCGDDFVLLYDLGHAGVSATAEKKALVGVWSDAAVKGYQIFSNDQVPEDVRGVRYLNDHPNEAVDVDPALYGALEQVARSGDRSLYLGPVYEYYDNIFYCQDEAQTADFDPLQNEDVRGFYARCAAFARDPAAVDVELLEDGQARLNVSEEYLAFAEEQGIGSFIDFYWMKNAFLADYLADTLTEKGYTNGTLSSFDGFARTLYDGEEDMLFNVYDRAVLAGTMSYRGPMSVVQLRSYPLNSQDGRHYYEMPDGRICTAYLDVADGLCRTARDDLIVHAREMSCGETLLRVLPLYVTDTFDSGALSAMEAEGIYAVLCEDGKIRYSDAELTVTAGAGYDAVHSGA